MRATIKDVAREAGVSVSTVSYALSRKGKAVKETHKRVLEAAEKLGYVPDAKARSLVQNRTNSIGLILLSEPHSDDDNTYDPFFAGVVSLFAEEMAKHGSWVSLYLTHGDADGLQDYLIGSNVDGLIWYAVSNDVNEQVRTIAARRGLPYVGVFSLMAESRRDVSDVSRVVVDERGTVAEAAEYLMSLGHRRIMCMSSRERDHRASKFIEVIKANNCDYGKMLYGDYSEETAYAEMTKLIKSGETLPTAVFATSDYMAIGVMRAIRDAGLSVPEDISVIGFDDIILSRSVTPALTTCRQDIRAVARAAIDYIIKCRDDRDIDEIMRVEVPSKLILRDSVAAPKN